MRAQSAKTVSGYVYADAGEGESTTDMVFAGHDMICEKRRKSSPKASHSAKGWLFPRSTWKSSPFERRRINTYYENSDASGYEIIPFSACKGTEALTRKIARLPFVPQGEDALGRRAELILSMQSEGLKKRLSHTNAKSAVLGILGRVGQRARAFGHRPRV